MQMENHDENLKRICRICASIIGLKHGYINAKKASNYSDLLYTKFNVDIRNDENIHSKFVCGTCRKKLDRTVKGDVLINIADFEPHTLDCNFCKSNVKNKDLQIKIFDKITMSHGYNKVIVHGSTCNCTYSKYNFEQGLPIGKFYFCVMGNNHWYIQVGEKTFDYSLDVLSTLPAIFIRCLKHFTSNYYKRKL